MERINLKLLSANENKLFETSSSQWKEFMLKLLPANRKEFILKLYVTKSKKKLRSIWVLTGRVLRWIKFFFIQKQNSNKWITIPRTARFQNKFENRELKKNN